MEFAESGSDVTSQKANGKSPYQRRPKPPFSYIALIAMAIRDSPTGRLTLAEINDYLMKKFPFFRGEYIGWRNSVRHNLSLNECFQKVLRDPNRPWGKDNYWMLNESSDYTFADGVFRRRRKRLHKKCSKSKLSINSTLCMDGSANSAIINNFNPEHKLGFRKSRQSSFLIDDLLDRNHPKCEPLKPPKEAISTKLYEDQTSRQTGCENDDGRSSATVSPATTTAAPEKGKLIDTVPTKKSSPNSRRHHYPHTSHSSSPSRSSSISLSQASQDAHRRNSRHLPQKVTPLLASCNPVSNAAGAVMSPYSSLWPGQYLHAYGQNVMPTSTTTGSAWFPTAAVSPAHTFPGNMYAFMFPQILSHAHSNEINHRLAIIGQNPLHHLTAATRPEHLPCFYNFIEK